MKRTGRIQSKDATLSHYRSLLVREQEEEIERIDGETTIRTFHPSKIIEEG